MIVFDYRKPKNLKLNNVSLIDTIGIHHTGNDNDIWTNTNFHIDTNRWQWNGYGYYIHNGKTYIVRGYEYKNASIEEHNAHTVNIAIQGDYENNFVSEIDKKATKKLISRLLKELPNIKAIEGHNFFDSNICPGKNMPMDEFKSLLMTKEEVKFQKILERMDRLEKKMGEIIRTVSRMKN